MMAVAKILNSCGKDMATKYNLHHWDNSFIKSFAIVCFCSLKNEVYLVDCDSKHVATFMIHTNKSSLHFEKLGTLPSESGKGIGSFCLMRIEELALKAGCKRIFMEVYEPSQHAISFYEHNGYSVVDRKDSLKYCELVMEKSFV